MGTNDIGDYIRVSLCVSVSVLSTIPALTASRFPRAESYGFRVNPLIPLCFRLSGRLSVCYA